MDESIKVKAVALSEEGDCDQLYELIQPYIEKNDAFALHLFAGFSLASFNESDEEFSKRSIDLNTRASENGVAEASYRMGVNHLYGDDVDQNYEKASMYFERAIEQGHSYTKFTFGFSLYYGTDENPKDEVRGLNLMKDAGIEGVVQAQNELNRIELEKNA